LLEFPLDALGESALVGIFAPLSATSCAKEYEFCVYGSGLHCYANGTWTAEIAVLPQRQLRAVDTDLGCYPELAVGDNGLVIRRLGSWEVLDSGTTANLVTVGLRSGRFTAAAENGEVVEGNMFGILKCNLNAVAPRWLKRVDNAFNCVLPDQSGVDTVARERGFNTHVLGVTSDGRLVSTGSDSTCPSPEEWSCGAPLRIPVAFTVDICSASQNPLVVTADVVYGNNDCMEVP